MLNVVSMVRRVKILGVYMLASLYSSHYVHTLVAQVTRISWTQQHSVLSVKV